MRTTFPGVRSLCAAMHLPLLAALFFGLRLELRGPFRSLLQHLPVVPILIA
jgi:hypothetical protein